jgi:KAP-like P-loop domain-containing protein
VIDRRPGQSLAAHEKRGERAAHDALHHDELARAIVNHIENMPPGSVIAVQGAWGRGKTDVAARVYRLFEKSDGPPPIWIDPWQYGRPDLIHPVVVELLSRSGPADKREKIKGIARTLLHASNAMAFKAISVFVPFGSIIDPAKEPVDDLIDRAMGGGSRPDVDADPVHEMAERFRELVEVIAPIDSGKRLLVCVDDLDRCLPDHQIAMLEAIHFLTAAGANCIFLIAIDPVLVQQAALAHYRTSKIDINQYLDKLFQLRINLRSLQPEQIGALVKAELDDEVAKVLRDGLDADPDAVRSAFCDVFYLPELTNPRLVHRAFERLRLAAAANARRDNAAIRGKDVLVSLVVWCAVAERWPQLRQLLQATGNLTQWYGNINAICGHYGNWVGAWADRDEAKREELLAEAASIIDRLPGRLQQPDLGQFLADQFLADQLPGQRHELALLKEIDAILVSFGL